MALTKVTNDLQDALAAAQPTITSVGTLTNFTSTGIDDNATSNAITIDASENVAASGDVIVGSLARSAYAFVDSNPLLVGPNTNSSAGASFRNANGAEAFIMSHSSNEAFVGTGTNHPLSIRTNNTDRLKIDISGRVTMPYQPSFAMTGTTGGWVNNAGVLNFATTITNVGGHYSTTTKRFTAPVAGVYSISATILVSAVSGGHTYIRKNQSSFVNVAHPSYSSTNEYNFGSHTICMPMAVNDYVDLYLNDVYTGGNGVYVGGAYSSFSGFLIG